MKIVTTINELKQFVQQAKKEQKTIGFVPTMGFLHEGHLTLAHTAKNDNDIVIMSIFVNPTQFGPNEDFESYPRDLPRDSELAQSVGVDLLFAPSVEEMYPSNGGIQLVAGRQAAILCGASRPGHFDGVLQIVAKLFHLVEPTRAYFGQKDAQQAAIIETMVRDFNFPLEICTIAIVREKDGLAKSSRNVYLTQQERQQAPAIYAALQQAKEHFLQTSDANEAIERAKKYILENTAGRIDYLQLVSYPDLAEPTANTEKFLLAVAVYLGKTRLIDNIIFSIEGE